MSRLNYKLPDEKIALHLADPPHNCKLMVIKLPSGQVEHKRFYNIVDYTDAGAVFAVNDSKVIPARLHGRKTTGGKVEFLLLEKKKSSDTRGQIWRAFGKPAARLRGGMHITVNGSNNKKTEIKIIEKKDKGVFLLKTPKNIFDFGYTPLPPYIISRRNLEEDDYKNYQSLFARKPGSVAAPTSSLHFTDKLVKRIRKKGIDFVPLTLHIGPGTFRPLAEKPDPERIKLTEKSAKKLNKADKIITCGTTMMRTLETVFKKDKFRPFTGKTGLYIKPGYRFKTRKYFLTNFHLPGTPLLKMVAAYIDNFLPGRGEKVLLDLYNEALNRDYRFLSYGDGMLFVDERID
ncbi:MAG: S-adenosylmethionine:tRNA ribosyltransferase-isomerase [Elusimicrobiota bacterium]